MDNLEQIKAFLRNEIIAAMYMAPDELDEDALFSSYGLESTTLTKIVVNINLRFSTRLSVQDILPYQSVNRLTQAIHARLEGKTS
ncbi:acyl carrier protein [Serratia fonticola]|uniref:acyl carrier protein n=1 Tax=Serratia fonticola TaxID=47917 RepID=UPI0003AC7AA3|nr:acyl carrier protein [Serratia fonticola]ERK15262.1 hypothetical protein L580_2906 [Serratia fonticola AU-P3(3)]MEB7885627.1 acyl carrier protein [Serratia fonticola]